jgi:hypothetical protein
MYSQNFISKLYDILFFIYFYNRFICTCETKQLSSLFILTFWYCWIKREQGKLRAGRDKKSSRLVRRLSSSHLLAQLEISFKRNELSMSVLCSSIEKWVDREPILTHLIKLGSSKKKLSLSRSLTYFFSVCCGWDFSFFDLLEIINFLLTFIAQN